MKGGRILVNLLDSTRELIGRLIPIVILHRNNENRFDLQGAGVQGAECNHERE